MTGDVTLVSSDAAANDDGVFTERQWTTWDPYEVWLTRVKQPGDIAGKRRTVDAPKRTQRPLNRLARNLTGWAR
jgi:hypothetical protein